jgi:hypothetical protein
MGVNGRVDRVLVGSFRLADADVEVFEVEVRVDVRGDASVGAEDGLKIDVDEIVERVNVLLNESFDGEEGGQEIPFVLRRAKEAFSKCVLFDRKTNSPRRL